MPLLETNNPITVGPKKCYKAKAQDKDFKVAIVNIFKDLKEDMNKFLNEDHENTKKQFNEIKEKELKENELLIDDQETQT